MPVLDVAILKAWFLKNKREFPWRKNPDPYKVWVSEVMLQQTQTTVVIPYFLKWMEQFPTLEALALAPFEKVLKAWEGLGYYSRVRNLHAGAKQLLALHGAEIPNSKEALMQIKGLGPYTAGAILSFAFHQRAAAIDGNVARFLSRHFLIEEEISKPSTLKKMNHIVEDILPSEEPWILMEGLIELGACICKKQPLCDKCPLSESCKAFYLKIPHLFPKKAPSARVTRLKRYVTVLLWRDKILLKKGEKGKVMADLYEFPFFEYAEHKKIEKILQKEMKLKVSFIKELVPIEQHFTRYQVGLYPSLWRIEEEKEVNTYEAVAQLLLSRKSMILMPVLKSQQAGSYRADEIIPERVGEEAREELVSKGRFSRSGSFATASYEWRTWDEIKFLSFSAGHRRILKQLRDCL